jgi:hypothetical protein
MNCIFGLPVLLLIPAKRYINFNYIYNCCNHTALIFCRVQNYKE